MRNAWQHQVPAEQWSPLDGQDTAWSGTLDRLILGLLGNVRFCELPWEESPWASALRLAQHERQDLGSVWPVEGKRLTQHLWGLLDQHLKTLPEARQGRGYDRWCAEVRGWHEGALLRETLDGLPAVPQERSRRRL